MSDLSKIPRPLCLDLFAGTGSATAPIREHGCMEVVGFDISRKAKGRDVTADVRRLPIKPGVRPRFVWASPPCTEFSQLTALRVYHPGGLPRDPELGMVTVREAFRWARHADFYAIENVRGSEKYIRPEYGAPWLRKDAWCVWSNLPASIHSWGRWLKGRAARSRPTPSGLPRFRTGDRSKIPRPLADAVHAAVCPGGAA